MRYFLELQSRTCTKHLPPKYGNPRGVSLIARTDYDSGVTIVEGFKDRAKEKKNPDSVLVCFDVNLPDDGRLSNRVGLFIKSDITPLFTDEMITGMLFADQLRNNTHILLGSQCY